jgi:hypothetical protein
MPMAEVVRACATSSERAHCPTELQGFADGTP